MISSGGYNRTPVEERILSACSKDETTGCLRFNRRLDKDGYGQISHDNRTRRVHKVMWELKNGPVPVGMCLIHLCDDKYPIDSKEYRACCEISHLKLGTNKENIQRASELKRLKGGSKPGDNLGEKNSNSKLTDDELLALHERIKHKQYGSLINLAVESGISYPLAQKIAGGKYPRLNRLLASQ